MVAEAEHLLMAQTLSYVMRQDISSLAASVPTSYQAFSDEPLSQRLAVLHDHLQRPATAILHQQ